ncbi:MAG: RHS repeat-associated core domain-containing protein [Chloroflexota bacterium]
MNFQSRVAKLFGGLLTSQRGYSLVGTVRPMAGLRLITKIDLGYPGQCNYAYINLLDYGARWYSASLGRFTQPDSIIPNPMSSQSFNRYSYVNNNPVKYNDPSGHVPTGADDDTPCLPNSPCYPQYFPATEVDEEQLTSFVNDTGTKVGGKQVYDLYLRYWNNKEGEHWDIFGNDGDFSIWDFLSYMLYWESGQRGDNSELIAEGTVRFFFGTVSANTSASVTNILNWWGKFSESTARRYVAGVDGDHIGRGNSISDVRQFNIFGQRFQNPGDWEIGWRDGVRGYRPDRPFGFGNLSVYYHNIDDKREALFIYIPGDDPFIIPSGCAYASAEHHWENVCPAVTP